MVQKIDCLRKTSTCFSLLLMVLLIGGCSANTGGNEKTADYSNLNKEVLLETINEMTITENNPFTSEELMKACGALAEQAEGFTDNDLLAIIENDKMTSITKTTLIQIADKINQGKGIIDQKPFEKFISKKSIEEDVRINLLQTLDMNSKENKDVLENIVKSEDGAIVVRSLMMLQTVDANKALSVSNEIIDRYKNYNDDAIRVAVMVKSDYFRDLKLADIKTNLPSEKRHFINFCISRYNTSQDEIFKDAMVFSLMNIYEFEAVKEIVKHKSIDDSLKVSCISRNCRTFVEVINNNPTKEDVEFIIMAMEMIPIRDLMGLMKEKLASNPLYRSDRLDNVITIMEIRGVPADEKRNERTPNANWLE